MKIALGMSGGVDSSAAALILKNQGYTVGGITLKLFGESDNDAKTVCEKLNIEHKTVDLTKLFKNTVIENFISEYENGRTPNPCIVCNEKIKFGAMLESALSLDFDMIATGHYAKISKQNGRFILEKAKDLSKDQSYVLYGLTQHQLSHTVLPLGEFTKQEIRALAEENGFVNANKKDSQDICFVPDGEYAKFIENETGKPCVSGHYTDINGAVLGKHNGQINYTIGQRKGLGIALQKPQYVLSKDAKSNTVILGDEINLFCKNVIVKNVNFIPFDELKNDLPVKAKLRYRHTEQPATLHPISRNEVLLRFENPQRAPAPGQSAVFYDGDIVIGGGIIEKGY